MLQKWFNTSTPYCDHEIISFHQTHGQEDVKTRCEEPDVEAKRREEEEEAVASILEEVLASSPELANNHEADKPPTP